MVSVDTNPDEVVTKVNIEFSVTFTPVNDTRARYQVLWYLGINQVLSRATIPLPRNGSFVDGGAVTAKLGTNFVENVNFFDKVSYSLNELNR